MTKRIGILTAGSDSPGLNAAIRAIGKSAQGDYGMEIVGFQDGFHGLVHNETVQPTLSGILTAGGTVLGTSRAMPHEGKEGSQMESAVATYHRHNLDCLVCIGGKEAVESALRLSQNGVNVMVVPKGIDNDLAMTDTTIGFDTALTTATEAIDRLHSTAHSHHRIILVEIMGRNTGWLALGSGLAGGADVIVIPEIPYDVRKISDAILARNRSGRRFSIVAVSEGGISKDTVEFFQRSKNMVRMSRPGEDQAVIDQRMERIESGLSGNTIYLSNRLEKFTGLDTRITILGHLLRGGAPSAADRVLATYLGTTAVRLVNEGRYGIMVAVHNREAVPVPLEEVAGKHKQIPMDHAWLDAARRVGTNFGE